MVSGSSPPAKKGDCYDVIIFNIENNLSDHVVCDVGETVMLFTGIRERKKFGMFLNYLEDLRVSYDFLIKNENHRATCVAMRMSLFACFRASAAAPLLNPISISWLQNSMVTLKR